MANEGFSISVSRKKSDELTASEWKLVREVEKGASNKEIAQTLNLSEGTVRNYLSTILDKLDLRDRTQLAIWAVQMSLEP
jgi:DNA-binding NarL/FixJ family response regulator